MVEFVPIVEGVSFTKGQGGKMYSLKWNRYPTIMTSGLAELLEDTDTECSMTDVTLACEGEFVQAHKVVLALSSPFFKKFFKMNCVYKAGTTLIALANMDFKDLKNIIHFIYHGEVNLDNEDLSSFLEAANMLEIQGLIKPPPPVGETEVLANKISAPTTESSLLPSVSSSSSISSSKSKQFVTRPPPAEEDPCHSAAKRIRVSSATVPVSTNVHLEVSQPVSVPASNPASTSLEGYSSMAHNEGDEEEEEMISIEDVKPAHITVYSIDESNNAEDEAEDSMNAGNSSSQHESTIEYQDQQLNFSEVQTNVESDRSCDAFDTLGIGSNAVGYDQDFSGSIRPAASTEIICDDRTSNHGNAGKIYDAESQATRYACLCGVTFSKKYNLIRHISEMNEKYEAKCENCGQIFDRPRNMQRHERLGVCKRNHSHRTKQQKLSA